MPEKRRKFARPSAHRDYRRIFLIAAEGVKTEPQYFALFNNQQSVVRVDCLKHNQASSPAYVLKRMTEALKRYKLRPTDQAWLVVDKDNWTDEQLDQLHEWAQRGLQYGLALSNPNFEYWLLLHFEDHPGIESARACIERLQRHLPDYDKGVDPRKITRERIDGAIARAQRRDTPPCRDWPRAPSNTTVYRLVRSILQT